MGWLEWLCGERKRSVTLNCCDENKQPNQPLSESIGWLKTATHFGEYVETCLPTAVAVTVCWLIIFLNKDEQEMNLQKCPARGLCSFPCGTPLISGNEMYPKCRKPLPSLWLLQHEWYFPLYLTNWTHLNYIVCRLFPRSSVTCMFVCMLGSFLLSTWR